MPGPITALAGAATAVQTCPRVSQSGSAGVRGQLRAEIQSWELLSELFAPLSARLKNISERARESPAASEAACSPVPGTGRRHQEPCCPQ